MIAVLYLVEGEAAVLIHPSTTSVPVAGVFLIVHFRTSTSLGQGTSFSFLLPSKCSANISLLKDNIQMMMMIPTAVASVAAAATTAL